MRRVQSVPLVTAAVVGWALLAGAARRPVPEWPRYLVTDREVFLPQEPQLVAAPPVERAEWSSDGRYVLAVRQTPTARPRAGGAPPSAAEVSLAVWNRRTGSAREIWKRPAALQKVEQLGWLPRSSIALMVLGTVQPTPEGLEVRSTLFRIDAAQGQTRVLGELQGQRLMVSPAQPLAVLTHQQQSSLQVVRADGSLGPALPVPKGAITGQWSPDGHSLYLVNWEKPAAPGQPPIQKWQAIDLRTGSISALPGTPEQYEEKPQPVRLRSSVTMLKEERTNERVSPLWLESVTKSEQPRVLVSADSDAGALAPDARAVLYLSQGAAWVRPLTRLPREPALAQIRAAQREATVSRAKQIGLAFAMYAQDYDEVFPPAGAAVLDRVRPYVKDGDVFISPGESSPGFVYLLSGLPLGSFPNPATQELGYLPGPGGRAVIFVDGHVEWRSDG